MRIADAVVLGIASLMTTSGMGNTALAAVIYSEAVSGDLSGNPSLPTSSTISPGTHTISGSVGSGDTQDWINLTVPGGMSLTSLVLDAYQASDARAFIGLQSGTAFVGPDQEAASYLGYTHFGPSMLGIDLLARMADEVIAFGSVGFDAPLASGNYTFLIQQFGDVTNYQFSITAVPVPEPIVASSLVCAAMALVFRQKLRW